MNQLSLPEQALIVEALRAHKSKCDALRESCKTEGPLDMHFYWAAQASDSLLLIDKILEHGLAFETHNGVLHRFETSHVNKQKETATAERSHGLG